MPPRATLFSFSKTGFQVIPPLLVFQTPLEAVAA